MLVLTGEYFVPQIAQITRTEVRKRTRRMNVNHRNLNGI